MNVIIHFKDGYELDHLAIPNVIDINIYEDEIEFINYADRKHEKIKIESRKYVPRKMIKEYEVCFYKD